MFYDLNDNPISSYSGSIDTQAEHVYNIKVDCRTGRFLACGPVSDMVIEARAFGDLTWIDLESNRIDLSAFNGTRRRFEIRVTAGAVTSITRRNIPLRVEP